MTRDLLNSPLLSRSRRFSRSASSQASPSSLKVRVAEPWLGGFNLLPYRQRNARLARRRCLREWLAAALAGVAAVVVLAAWQAFGKTRTDAERASIERSFTQMAVPLAEHARLTRAQDEQRKATALAMSLSEPLTHFRDLLDALSFEPGNGVVLRQLRQREHDTELLATSRGHLASAEWLKRLGAIRGVTGTEMSDLHRPVLRAHALADESVTGPIEFGARLLWREPVLKAVRAVAAAAASRPVKSEISGGTK
ncbi:type IV pilus assembly protein PilN [Paraburkholderia fungorum]|uniref:Type IV pilus assembly protein PilN n=1 Tax=Paraburkholderia fungorum TaxID=134537 RepID=A0A1H1ETE9_9BURK|nr:fimbrial assembly protein [Paraburkholderia fungorum]SDQ91396.1 type IV pilus assembly protein PilN [Paraburkholderia fungorum]